MKSIFICGFAAAATCCLAGVAGAAPATTIDFGSMTPGTAVSSLDGITFSLKGGPESSGPPLIGLQDFPPEGLVNSDTDATYNDYPTANILDLTFSHPASNVSFYFNNQGYNGTSFYAAYDSSHNLLETGSLTDAEGSNIVLAASGIADLQFNNGQSSSADWVFDVPSITFSAGVPEPASWALMLIGVGALGATMRSRRTALTNA